MLQINGNDERIRVWRLQRERVRTSVEVCAKLSEKDRMPAKGTDVRPLTRGYDRP